MEEETPETAVGATEPEVKKETEAPGKHFYWLYIALVAVVLGAGGAFAYYHRSNPSGAKNKVSSSPTTEVSKGDSASSSSAELISSSLPLQCVPRGHDNYRTNNAFAVDPKDSKIMYVGVEYKGVYKSLDAGATWTKSDTGVRGYPMENDKSQKCIQELGRIVIDPTDSTHLLLSRVESPSTLEMIFGETAGLYESKDSGATWKQVISKTMNASGSRGIAFDPKDPKTMYYGVNNMHPSFTVNGVKRTDIFNTTGILYRTTDAAQNWSELPTTAPLGFRTMGVWVDPTDPKKIWLLTFSQSEDGKGLPETEQKGAMKTLDGGATWNATAAAMPTGNRQLAEAWAVDPNNFNHILVSTQNLTSGQTAYVSFDAGITWTKSDQYYGAVSFDPFDKTGLHLLSYNQFGDGKSLYESKDGGKTWVAYGKLPTEVDGAVQFGVRISSITWDSLDKDTVYMSGANATVWKSVDAGLTWKSIFTIETAGGKNKNGAGNEKSSEQDQ